MGEPVDPAGGAARRAAYGAPEPAEHTAAADPIEPEPMATLLRELTELREHVGKLESQLRERSSKLDDVAKRLTRLERRIDRASATFPVRTALSLRRRLYRLLK